MSQLVTTSHNLFTLSNKVLHYVTLFIMTYCEKCVTKRYFPWHIVTSQKCIKNKIQKVLFRCHSVSHFVTPFHALSLHFFIVQIVTACHTKKIKIAVIKHDILWQAVTICEKAVTSRDKLWQTVGFKSRSSTVNLEFFH